MDVSKKATRNLKHFGVEDVEYIEVSLTPAQWVFYDKMTSGDIVQSMYVLSTIIKFKRPDITIEDAINTYIFEYFGSKMFNQFVEEKGMVVLKSKKYEAL